MANGSLTIPKWVVATGSLAVVVAILPWSAWVTMTLAGIKAEMGDLCKVQARLETHLDDPTLHRGALAGLEAKMEGVERELSRLSNLLEGSSNADQNTPRMYAGALGDHGGWMSSTE